MSTRRKHHPLPSTRRLRRPRGNGRTAHRDVVTAAARTARAARAYDLLVHQHLTYQQIADQLAREGMPCTAKTVCVDIQDTHAALRRLRLDLAEQRQAIEAARLDQYARQLLPILYDQLPPESVTRVGGKEVVIPVSGAERTRLRIAAAIELRRISESRRRLFGDDAAPTVGPTDEQIAAVFRSLTADFLALVEHDAALRAQMAEVVRRRLAGFTAAPAPDEAATAQSDSSA